MATMNQQRSDVKWSKDERILCKDIDGLYYEAIILKVKKKQGKQLYSVTFPGWLKIFDRQDISSGLFVKHTPENVEKARDEIPKPDKSDMPTWNAGDKIMIELYPAVIKGVELKDGVRQYSLRYPGFPGKDEEGIIDECAAISFKEISEEALEEAKKEIKEQNEQKKATKKPEKKHLIKLPIVKPIGRQKKKDSVLIKKSLAKKKIIDEPATAKNKGTSKKINEKPSAKMIVKEAATVKKKETSKKINEKPSAMKKIIEEPATTKKKETFKKNKEKPSSKKIVKEPVPDELEGIAPSKKKRIIKEPVSDMRDELEGIAPSKKKRTAVVEPQTKAKEKRV